MQQYVFDELVRVVSRLYHAVPSPNTRRLVAGVPLPDPESHWLWTDEGLREATRILGKLTPWGQTLYRTRGSHTGEDNAQMLACGVPYYRSPVRAPEDRRRFPRIVPYALNYVFAVAAEAAFRTPERQGLREAVGRVLSSPEQLETSLVTVALMAGSESPATPQARRVRAEWLIKSVGMTPPKAREGVNDAA